MPGVYCRGSKFVVAYRAAGRQRKQSADTLADARAIKLQRDGEARAPRRGPTLHEFSLSWLDPDRRSYGLRTPWVEVRVQAKEASRRADARAVAAGRKSADEVREENEVFAPLARAARADLRSSRSLG